MGPDPIKQTVSTMPEPNPVAIEAERDRDAKASEALTDLAGNSFDPTQHETEVDGSPRVSRHGKLMRKRGMGAQGARRPVGDGRTVNAPGPGAQRQYAAMGATQCVVMCGMALGGDEWAPSKDEKLAMDIAFANYMTAKGIDDLPPGLALTFALFFYMVPRLSQPKTKSTLTKIKEWGSEKFTRAYVFLRFGRNARIDRRNDSERENVSGKGTGEGVSAA